MEKNWKIAEPVSVEMRKKFIELDPVTLQLLVNRGLTTQEQIDEFLNPDYSQDLHDPFLFSKMKEAVERVFKAFESNEKIFIYSDYDADGVCSGTIVYQTLTEIAEKLNFPKEKIDFYIPHRDKEGYGLNQEAITQIHSQGCGLLITTDLGISNYEEITWLRKKGIDVIVIDHHQVPDRLPDALIIHAFAPGEIYPFKYLSAAGVAFKFASAMIAAARERGLDFIEGHEKWLLDLVAIATVTDMMPLLGENRTMEKYGLVVLKKTKRPGIRCLLEFSRTPVESINARTIGFQIGPRLNAASRMDHANRAFKLLNSDDPQEARQLAAELNSLNMDRQDITKKVFEEAISQIGEVIDQKILFAKNQSWPPGIVGLVAGRVADEFYRPTILVGSDSNAWIGSGRSIPEFDITAALHKVEKYLKRFGGHPGACGFDLKSEEDFDAFARELSQVAEKELKGVNLIPSVNIEAEVSLEKANFDLVKSIDDFAPFGMDNPQPILMAKNLTIISFEAIGADLNHLKIMASEANGKVYKLIGFGIAERIGELKTGAKIDLAYELGINRWNGNQELQFKIVDFVVQ